MTCIIANAAKSVLVIAEARGKTSIDWLHYKVPYSLVKLFLSTFFKNPLNAFKLLMAAITDHATERSTAIEVEVKSKLKSRWTEIEHYMHNCIWVYVCVFLNACLCMIFQCRNFFMSFFSFSTLILRHTNSFRGVILWALLHCWSVTLRCAHWTMWLHFQEIACTPIRSNIRIQECSVQSHNVGLLLGLILFQSVEKKKVNGFFP